MDNNGIKNIIYLTIHLKFNLKGLFLSSILFCQVFYFGMYFILAEKGWPFAGE
jgi:hypothetical protein